MTLTRLLGIKLELIRFEDERGLEFAKQVWQSLGGPSEPRALVDALEKCLQRCTDEGIPYPAILLRRKKELERGTWSPPAKQSLDADVALPKEGDPSCPQCRGTGQVVIDDGHGYCSRFCECKKLLAGQR